MAKGLARFGGGGKKFGGGGKGLAKFTGKAEKVSGPGHLIISHGSHAIAALASRELGPVKLPFVNIEAYPDTIALGVSLAGVALGGKKLGKLARSTASGAAHAIEGRVIWSGKQRFATAEKPAETTSASSLKEELTRMVQDAVKEAVSKLHEEPIPAAANA